MALALGGGAIGEVLAQAYQRFTTTLRKFQPRREDLDRTLWFFGTAGTNVQGKSAAVT